MIRRRRACGSPARASSFGAANANPVPPASERGRFSCLPRRSKANFASPSYVGAGLKCLLLLFPQIFLLRKNLCGSPIREVPRKGRKECAGVRWREGQNSLSLAPLDSVSRGGNCARSGNFPTMGNFQARKWQKAHRAFCKKAFARPRRGSQEWGVLRSTAPSMREPRWVMRSTAPSERELRKGRSKRALEMRGSHMMTSSQIYTEDLSSVSLANSASHDKAWSASV